MRRGGRGRREDLWALDAEMAGEPITPTGEEEAGRVLINIWTQFILSI